MHPVCKLRVPKIYVPAQNPITVFGIPVLLVMATVNKHSMKSKMFIQIKKVMEYHCVGHHQKRLGNRLRKLKKRVKGLGGKTKKTNEKVVGGRVVKSKVLKGRLTDSVIDTLQNYFGIALRSGHIRLRKIYAVVCSLIFSRCII